MEKELRILILEDVPADAELMERELRKGGMKFSSKRVDTRKAFLKELKDFEPDLILGDYKLPSFDGLSALAIVREKFPDIPFIFVSGSIGEELAIETLKRGATDYVLKDRLSRLVPGVNRVLREIKEQTDRKQAEMELNKERDRAQRYLDIAGVMLVVININQEVILINRKGCEILGYEEGEIIGRNWFDHFIPERDRKSVKEVFAKLVAAEIEPVEHFENTVLTKSGMEKIIAWHNAITTDENGHIMGTLSSGEDITDRKRAEKSLQESEKRYREFVENATEIIYTVDEKGNFTYANPAALKVTGYSLTELRSFNYADLVLPEHRERVSQIYINQLRQKLPNTYMEFPFLGKTGEIIWFGQNSTIVIEGNKIVGFHIIARDVTERKQAEEALRESEERYRILVETSPDAITLLDLNLNIIMANQPALRLYGHESAEEIKGKNGVDYLVLEERGRALEDMRQILETGSMGPIEYMLVKKDGSPFPAELKASLVLDSQRKPGGIILVSRDITERKAAEERLRLQSAALEATANAIIITDHEGMIEWANLSFTVLTGYSHTEVVGRNPRELIKSGEHNQTFYKDLWDTILAGEVWRGQIINRRKDSGLYTEEMTITPLRNERGEISRFIAIKQDITERRRAEEALRASENKYRILIENVPQKIFLKDKNAVYISCNENYAHDLKIKSDEISGKTDYDFYPKELAEKYRADHKKIIERGRTEEVEEKYIQNGQEVWVNTIKTPVKDEKGNLVGILGIFWDITGRKRAEESLKQSEENARQLAQENAIMAEVGRIISSTLDINEVYEGFSAEVKKIISFDRIVINNIDTEKGTVKNVYIAGKGVQDRNVKDVYPLEGSGNAEMVRTKSTFLLQAEDFTEYKDRFPMLRSTFEAGYRSIVNVPLFSKGEIIGGLLLRSKKPHAYTDKEVRLAERIGFQIAGAIANAQLYAERIESEKEREALQEQLRQSQKMEAIGKLAGGVAHDFNNLLTVIKGYCQLSLVEMKESAPIRDTLEVINKAAEKAADLTRQLLAFSRRQIMEMRVLDLNALLQNLDKMLPRIIGEDIELVTSLGEDLGRVKADPGQIEQVVMNLAVNAKDAMSKGGKLIIETANVELDEAYARTHVAVTPGPYVMIAVSDTGTGMPLEVRDRVFEPFFTTKGKGKGTGLGLSTVYGIVKQSNGNIWVYSEPGKGTTFKIFLPRVDEPAEKLKVQEIGEEFPRGSETILVVEDDKEVRNLTVRILKRQGYTVLDGSYGDEAFSVCRQHKGPIHLLLTDVVMPGMDGRALSESLSQLHPEMKVLYMSGYTDDAIVHHGVMEKGMNYIQKPFTVNGLTKKVREVLDKSRHN